MRAEGPKEKEKKKEKKERKDDGDTQRNTQHAESDIKLTLGDHRSLVFAFERERQPVVRVKTPLPGAIDPGPAIVQS